MPALRHLLVSLIAALVLGNGNLPAQDVPAAPDTAELRAVTTRGRMLAEYDRASWHGTDVVRARMPRPVGVEGLLAVRSADGRWRVLFGRLSAGKDSLIVVARAVQATRADSFQATIHEGTVLGDDGERNAFRALQAAGADLQRGPVPHNGPYNSYVLPRPAGGWWVYFLPAQVQRGVYPHGGDFRYAISADGATVMEKLQMHRTVLMSQVPPDGAAGFHTSIVSGTPVDSDVFLVLTRQPAKPELVATQHFHYEIRTDGSITWQPASNGP